MSKSHHMGHLVKETSIREFITAYQVDVRKTLSDSSKSIYEKHNCLVDWTLTLLFFATGHRPIIDPFCYFRHINLDSGWCLVDDKTVEERRRFRLVPLPAISIEQFRGYFSHLKLLGARLSRNKNSLPLGQAILSILENSNEPVLPLFFYLNEEGQKVDGISTSDVHGKWKKYIEIPKNEGRRSLASGLRIKGVDSELIRILLGHEDGLDVHFDYSSRWSPKDALCELSLEINKLLESWGFRVVPGFLRRNISRSLKVEGTVQPVEFGRLFGSEIRVKARHDLDHREETLVNNLLSDKRIKSTESPLSESNVKWLLRRIVSLAERENLKTSRCLAVAYRSLKKMRLNKQSEKFLRRRVPIKRPVGFVHEELASQCQSLDEARSIFLNLIIAKDFSSLDSSDKIALISISAVLMDYLIIPWVFEQMASELQLAITRVGDLVMADFFFNVDKRSYFRPPSYRWVPRGLSKALLLKTFEEGFVDSYVDEKRVFQQQAMLLKKIFPKIKSSGERRQHLFCITKSGLFMDKHPLLRGYYEEESGYTSLPSAALERVINGTRFSTSLDDRSTNNTSASLRRKNEANEKSAPQQTNKELFDEIKSAFKITYEAPILGNNRHRRQPKKVLRRKILELMKESKWTITGKVLLNWVIELCDNGTQHKESLALRTIDEYVFIIARPLLEQARDINILMQGESYFEELYIRMVSYSNRSAPFYVIERIKELHRFCESNYGVPDIDWSPIYREITITQVIDRNKKANANVLSLAEYRAALTLLVYDPKREPLYKCQQGFCLIMGYRFGLRIDEVFSLIERQVRFDETLDAIRVSLKTNIYGDGKSASFSRNIPLLTELDDIEKSIFKRVLDAAADQQKETDSFVLVMAKEGSSRDLHDKKKISELLNLCLKNVTGDQTVRFHHLRHTWATSIGVAILELITGFSSNILENLKQGSVFHKEKMWALLRPDKPDIEGVCKIMGHANIRTFIASYLHCLEYVQPIQAFSKNNKLIDKALAHVLGISDVSLRKRYSRLDKNKGESIFPLSKGEFKIFPVTNMNISASPINSGDRAQAETSLFILNKILLSKQLGASLVEVAERSGVSKDIVNLVFEKAVDLEIRAKYYSYQLLTCEKSVTDIFTNKSENKRFNQYISNIEDNLGGETFLSDQMLRDFTETWIWGHRDKESYFILRNIEHLDIIHEGLARLGMGNAIVELIVGSDDQKSSLKTSCMINIQIKKLGAFPPTSADRKNGKEQVGVRLTGLPASIGTMGTFHRLLFILSLYLSIKI